MFEGYKWMAHSRSQNGEESHLQRRLYGVVDNQLLKSHLLFDHQNFSGLKLLSETYMVHAFPAIRANRRVYDVSTLVSKKASF